MQRGVWAVGGLFVGGAVAVALAVLVGFIGGLSQAEGAYAMAVAFFWAPLGAMIGLVTGLILGRRR
jgi:hypothetical protein